MDILHRGSRDGAVKRSTDDPSHFFARELRRLTARLLQGGAILACLLIGPPRSYGVFTFDEGDSVPEVTVGGRLFLETRFSQYFFANSAGRINDALRAGDPTMSRTAGVAEDLPGPFSGRSMNCRACHLVNEHQNTRGGGIRAYTDYARRSPIPGRGDGEILTLRRSPILVNSTLARSGSMFLHYDGEFTSIEDLVCGTLTGRNFGWLPGEKATAVRHIADVIRKDDGTDLFAQGTAGLSYATLLKGVDSEIPPFVRIPEDFRIDAAEATDEELLRAVAKLIGAYVDSLRFAAFLPDKGAQYFGSPYDVFLIKNGLPQRPRSDESSLSYARRLRERLSALSEPVWVTETDWAFFSIGSSSSSARSSSRG